MLSGAGGNGVVPRDLNRRRLRALASRAGRAAAGCLWWAAGRGPRLCLHVLVHVLRDRWRGQRNRRKKENRSLHATSESVSSFQFPVNFEYFSYIALGPSAFTRAGSCALRRDL